MKLKVLIVGMKGVGMECAKNLVLAGPGQVTICDGNTVLVFNMLIFVRWYYGNEGFGGKLFFN